MARRYRIFKPLGRAGNAGVIASFVIAIMGVAIGAFAAYIGEYGAAARASRVAVMNADIRDPVFNDDVFREREKIIQRVLASADLERLLAPALRKAETDKPKIIIIFDDMGLDPQAFERATALPGPLTFSFLPYARDVDRLARLAVERGGEVMMHLPMEPEGDADPGPNALTSGMTGGEFLKTLEANLDRFDGYTGVNNHMGSKLTADDAAMKTLLSYLDHRGLFFLDSVTTSATAVRRAGRLVGAEVFARDVFLDAETGDKAAIRQQLARAERIALETGYVVAICHPRAETLDVLGPWLAAAPLRGFELAPASALPEIRNTQKQQKIMAMAPPLRL